MDGIGNQPAHAPNAMAANVVCARSRHNGHVQLRLWRFVQPPRTQFTIWWHIVCARAQAEGALEYSVTDVVSIHWGHGEDPKFLVKFAGYAGVRAAPGRRDG